MKLTIKKGTTSKRLAIFVQDSSSTTGAGLAALLFNSASLAWYYWREDEGNAGGTTVTLVTATRGTFASGGFIEKDATNMPGFYEIGVPDAALATGANWVVMVLRGATNMAPLTLEIELVDYDPADGVRLGLTALPNAAADATGGLPISDAGGLDLDSKLANTNEVTAARMAALTDWINGGRLDLILDIIAVDVVNIDGAAMRGTDNAALASVLGALADAAAAGDPTSADTVMQYLKQLINTLEGTTGIPVYPAAADPANNVSLAEVVRAIRDDVTGLAGTAMRGTDGASTHGDPDPGGLIANLDAAMTTRSSHSAADVWTSGTRTLTSFGTLIADIWHHLLSAITTASSIGKLIKDSVTEARMSELDAGTGGKMANQVDLIKTETDKITLVDAGTGVAGSVIEEVENRAVPADLGTPQKNQAFSNIEFLLVDSTDHVTPETGLSPTGQRSIDGGAFGAVSGAITEVGNGIYQFDALAADMNGDTIMFRFFDPAADDTFVFIKTRA